MHLKASVFLVDYGSSIEIEVKKRVRKLQLKDQAVEPPLAFKIILAGLYPISMVNQVALTLYFLTKCCRTLTGCRGARNFKRSGMPRF